MLLLLLLILVLALVGLLGSLVAMHTIHRRGGTLSHWHTKRLAALQRHYDELDRLHQEHNRKMKELGG